MTCGIKISVIWFDDDVIEVEVSASNARFSGVVSAYAGLDVLPKLAAALAGYPANPADVREFEFGTFDPSFAGGGARFRFYCLNGAGHACVEVQLRSDPSAFGFNEAASFTFEVEAAAIDAFVRQLNGMRRERGAVVFLPAISSAADVNSDSKCRLE